MSGGHFSESHYALDTIAEEMERIILREEKGAPLENDDEYLRYFSGFSKETLEKMREAMYNLKRVSNMVHRIDYLVSGDDGEDSFHERWKEDVQKPWEETK